MDSSVAQGRPVPPEIEVWNRATTGVPYSDLPGDVALAHALRFDGYASAGSVFGGLEMEIGEGWQGQGRAGFAHFGLDEVVALLDEALAAYNALNESDIEGDEHGDRYEELDRDYSGRYDDTAQALDEAMRAALAADPSTFAPTTGFEVEGRIETVHAADWVPPLDEILASDPDERHPYAVDVNEAERSRRTAAALVAFGFEAREVDGHVEFMPPGSEDEWPLVDAIFALIDRRYPPA